MNTDKISNKKKDYSKFFYIEKLNSLDENSLTKKFGPQVNYHVITTHGGQGSGNFGHEGRPGEQGGSGKGGASIDLEKMKPDRTPVKEGWNDARTLGEVSKNFSQVVGDPDRAYKNIMLDLGRSHDYLEETIKQANIVGKEMVYLKDTFPDVWDKVDISMLSLYDTSIPGYGRWSSNTGILRIGTDVPVRSEEKLTLGKYKSCTESVQGTFRHEFGHAVYDSLTDSQRSKWNEDVWAHEPARFRSKVSEYATTNRKEAFAESFRAWSFSRYHTNAKSLPKAVEKFFETHLGKDTRR
jgi:hypothetical protein